MVYTGETKINIYNEFTQVWGKYQSLLKEERNKKSEFKIDGRPYTVEILDDRFYPLFGNNIRFSIGNDTTLIRLTYGTILKILSGPEAIPDYDIDAIASVFDRTVDPEQYWMDRLDC